MRQILVPKRPHDVNVCMQKKQTLWGILVHKEEKTIHRSITPTRDRDFNRTLIGGIVKEKECVSRTRLQVGEKQN